MPKVSVGARASFPAVRWLALGCLLAGCKAKASESECDQLLERYARLVVLEKFPDASADVIAQEQQREKAEARGDDAFKNCRSQVSRGELECAMIAKTTSAFEKCLE
jgi:hypothetical protein